MMKVTVLFDPMYHTVNGKQDSVSFAVNSADEINRIVDNANKMGSVSDIRVTYRKDGCLRTEYVFCVEKYDIVCGENYDVEKLVERKFFFDNGTDFDADDLEAFQIMADDWESVLNHETVFKNTKRWSL